MKTYDFGYFVEAFENRLKSVVPKLRELKADKGVVRLERTQLATFVALGYDVVYMRNCPEPFQNFAMDSLATSKHKCSTTNRTFEEDGADLMGFRLAYNVFKKAKYVNRRKIYFGYADEIDNDKLFFYSMATQWCARRLVKKKSDGVHSVKYARVNMQMAQLDEFAKTFKCKKTDRMVRSKADHCELYGEHGPLTRKFAQNF
ncbi:unnamed protein product [Caenorhabditis bovis]|nr:unnamed protein product [Caenorhabditis bovis]